MHLCSHKRQCSSCSRCMGSSGGAPSRGMSRRRTKATPMMRRGATLAVPGPLYSTAPSTIIMQGIMGAPSTCSKARAPHYLNCSLTQDTTFVIMHMRCSTACQPWTATWDCNSLSKTLGQSWHFERNAASTCRLCDVSDAENCQLQYPMMLVDTMCKSHLNEFT